MNIRTVIFSGVMTALIGAMIGIGVAHIGNRQPRQRVIMFGGAILGFVVGSGQELVRQQQKQRDREDLNTTDSDSL